jgi:hypothetical protein
VSGATASKWFRSQGHVRPQRRVAPEPLVLKPAPQTQVAAAAALVLPVGHGVHDGAVGPLYEPARHATAANRHARPHELHRQGATLLRWHGVQEQSSAPAMAKLPAVHAGGPYTAPRIGPSQRVSRPRIRTGPTHTHTGAGQVGADATGSVATLTRARDRACAGGRRADRARDTASAINAVSVDGAR